MCIRDSSEPLVGVNVLVKGTTTGAITDIDGKMCIRDSHYTCGDMLDLHNYPQPEMYLYDAQRATVLGEYGGIGLVLKDHIWEPNRNWGYVQFNSSKEVTDEYVKYADMLYQMIKRGFSAAVYTQTTDVEVEVNGLMTYDRKVIKLDEKRVKEINTRICNSLKK